LLLLALGSTFVGCTSETAKSPLAVVIAADTAGWIVPCGCTSNQSGGLSRRASYVHGVERNSGVIVADAGGAPAGTSAYDRIKFAAILAGEKEMGVVAHNLGAAELAWGPKELTAIARAAHVPFVSANACDEQSKLLFAPAVLVERAGSKVLLVGVVAPKFATAGISVRDPRTAVLDALAKYPPAKRDAVIVLAYLPADELRSLASALPEVDLIVGGPTRQSIEPEQVGPVVVAAVTNKGKFIAHFTAPPEPGARWQGQIVEMTEKYPTDVKQQEVLQAFRQELEEQDLPASQTGFAAEIPANAPASFRIAGTASCQACHQEDCQSWQNSAHAHAWETLVKQDAHVDAYCQQCHTTGFGIPGGFVSAKQSALFTNVGCESCHGPSQAHVDQPATKTPFVATDQCLRCHDRENSPKFDYQVYWDKISHGTIPTASSDAKVEEVSP
jgi:hypothetical protein